MIQVNNKYNYGDLLCHVDQLSIGLICIAVRVLVRNTGIKIMYDCRDIDSSLHNSLNPFDFHCFNESELVRFNKSNIHLSNLFENE